MEKILYTSKFTCNLSDNDTLLQRFVESALLATWQAADRY